MFSIGEFARLGRVSVRMLRHYDVLRLLTPARVDPHSGYRFYTADQLTRLNRILALSDLGIGLKQVAELLDEQPNLEQLCGMLRLRRTELAEQVAADTARLARVEARLRLIDSEESMSAMDVVVKPVAPALVVAVSGVAQSYQHEHIGPVVGALFSDLAERMQRAELRSAGPAVATYEPTDDDRVWVQVAAPYIGSPEQSGLATVQLPGLEQAATLVHHGAISLIAESYQALARWIDDNDYRAEIGHAREAYLHTEGDQTGWGHRSADSGHPLFQPAPHRQSDHRSVFYR